MVTVDAIVRLTAICIAFQALGVLSVGWMRFLRPFRIPVSVNAPTTSPDEFVGFHVSMDVGGRLLDHKLVPVRPPNDGEMTPRTLCVLSSSRSMLLRTVVRFTVQRIGGYRHVFIV